MLVSKNAKIDYFLIIILFSAFFIRVINIQRQSLTPDEIHSIQTITETHLLEKNIDIHPPFYYFCIHIWSLIFGMSYFSLRFFSVILSIVQILLINKLSKKLQLTDNMRYLFLFIFSFSTYHLYYSTDIKSYMLFLTFTLLNFNLILSKDIFETKNMILFVLINLLGLYTHNTYFIVYLVSLLFIIYREVLQKRIKKIFNFLIFQVITILFYIPQIIIIFNSQIQILIQRNAFQNYFIDFLKRYLGYFVEYSNFFIFIFIFYFFLFILAIIKTKNPFFKVHTFLYFLIPTTISLVFDITSISRHMIYFFPIFYYGIILGVFSINKKYLQIFVIFLIIAFNLISIIYYQTHYIKPPMYESIEYMKSENIDLVCFTNYEFSCELIEYHDTKNILLSNLKKINITNSQNISESFKNSGYDNIEKYQDDIILNQTLIKLKLNNQPYMMYGAYDGQIWFVESIIKNKNMSVLKKYESEHMYENKKIPFTKYYTNFPILSPVKVYIIS